MTGLGYSQQEMTIVPKVRFFCAISFNNPYTYLLLSFEESPGEKKGRRRGRKREGRRSRRDET